MKKWKKGLLLTIAALALAGCDNKTSTETDSGSSSSPISDNTSASNTSSSSDAEIWSNEETALMNEYCGGILPGLQAITGNSLDFQERETSDGTKFLAIFNEASSFTIKDYYITLEKAGWNVINGYDGNPVQVDSEGVSYVELTYTSIDNTIGYDMVYCFREASTDEEGNAVPARNIIQCYNDMTTTATTATSWTDEQKESMITTLTTEVPFVNLGSINTVYARSSSVFTMVDFYTEDLTSEYSDTLIADGYKLDTNKSESQNMYVLSKTLTDGATVEAYLYYMNGNNLNFIYTPFVTMYSAWPKDALKAIEEKTGVTVPEFAIDIQGHYYVFSKNGTLYIQGETTTVDSWSYESDLTDAGLYQENYASPYTNWEGNIEISAADIYDENYSQIGLQVAVAAVDSTYTLTTDWPTSTISDTIKNVLGVSDYTLPELTSLSTYTSTKIKYQVRDDSYIATRTKELIKEISSHPSWYEDLPEDYTADDIKALAAKLAKEEAGIVIKIKDLEESGSYTAYYEILENLGYHKVDGMSDGTFEDKDGKVQIALTSNGNSQSTTITVTKGSGEKHEPSISFGSESYTIGIGKTQRLQVTKDMLPYDVSYSSSNPDKISVNDKGFVTVSDTAAAGDTATITASVTTSDGKVYSATCTVTAIEVLDYDADSTISAINKLLKANGYDNAVVGTVGDDPSLTLTYDTSKDTTVTSSTLQTLAEEKLVLEGFSIITSMDVDTGDDVIWQNTTRWKDDVEIGSGVRMGCEFYYEEDEFAKVEVTYFVYTLNDNKDTLVFEIIAHNTDY